MSALMFQQCKHFCSDIRKCLRSFSLQTHSKCDELCYETARCTPQLYCDVPLCVCMCVCDYLLWSEPSTMSRLPHSRHFDEVPCVAVRSFFTSQIADFKKAQQLHLLLQLHIFLLLFLIFPSFTFLISHRLPSHIIPFRAPPPAPLLPPTAHFPLFFLLSLCCGCMWVTFLFWLVSIKILRYVHSARVCVRTKRLLIKQKTL